MSPGYFIFIRFWIISCTNYVIRRSNLLKSKMMMSFGRTFSSTQWISQVCCCGSNFTSITKLILFVAFIIGLFENLGSFIDPLRVISRIPKGLTIPGLKASLLHVLRDLGTQISLREGCKEILFGDTLELLERLCKLQKQGLSVQGVSTSFCITLSDWSLIDRISTLLSLCKPDQSKGRRIYAHIFLWTHISWFLHWKS